MSGRPLSFPTCARLWTGILGALIVSLAFFPIYVGGSMTTGVLGQRLHLYAAFELALPFWPAMIIAYLSMFALFLLALMDVATPRLRILYGLWLVVVCASTVLTHRHHLLDVAGGIAITLAAQQLRLRRAAAPSTQSSCIGAAP